MRAEELHEALKEASSGKRRKHTSIDEDVNLLEQSTSGADLCARAAERLRNSLAQQGEKCIEQMLSVSPAFASLLTAFDKQCTGSKAASTRAQSAIVALIEDLLGYYKSTNRPQLTGPPAQLDALARELAVNRSERLVALLASERVQHLALSLLHACAWRSSGACASAVAVCEQAERDFWRAAKPHSAPPAPHVAYAECYRRNTRDALVMLAVALVELQPKLVLSKTFICRAVFKGLSRDTAPLLARFLNSLQRCCVRSAVPSRLIVAMFNEAAFYELVNTSCVHEKEAREAAMSLIRALVHAPSSPLHSTASRAKDVTQLQRRLQKSKKSPSKLVMLLRHLRWDINSEHLRVLSSSLHSSAILARDFLDSFTPQLMPELTMRFLATATVLSIALHAAEKELDLYGKRALLAIPGVAPHALASGIRHRSRLVSFTTLKLVHAMLCVRHKARERYDEEHSALETESTSHGRPEEGSKSSGLTHDIDAILSSPNQQMQLFDKMLPPLGSVIDCSRAWKFDSSIGERLLRERAYAVLHLFALERPLDFEPCGILPLRIAQTGLSSNSHLIQKHTAHIANALLKDRSLCASSAVNAKQTQFEQVLDLHCTTKSLQVHEATREMLYTVLDAFSFGNMNQNTLLDKNIVSAGHTQSTCLVASLPSSRPKSACKLLASSLLAILRRERSLGAVSKEGLTLGKGHLGPLVFELISQSNRLTQSLLHAQNTSFTTSNGSAQDTDNGRTTALRYAAAAIGLICATSSDPYGALDDIQCHANEEFLEWLAYSAASEGSTTSHNTSSGKRKRNDSGRFVSHPEQMHACFAEKLLLLKTQVPGDIIHIPKPWYQLRKAAERNKRLCYLAIRLSGNIVKQEKQDSAAGVRLLDWMCALACICMPPQSLVTSVDFIGSSSQAPQKHAFLALQTELLIHCFTDHGANESTCVQQEMVHLNAFEPITKACGAHWLREGKCTLRDRSKFTMNLAQDSLKEHRNGNDHVLDALLRTYHVDDMKSVLTYLLSAFRDFPTPWTANALSQTAIDRSLNEVTQHMLICEIEKLISRMLDFPSSEIDHLAAQILRSCNCNVKHVFADVASQRQPSIWHWPSTFEELFLNQQLCRVDTVPHAYNKLAWYGVLAFLESPGKLRQHRHYDCFHNRLVQYLSPSNALSALEKLMQHRLERECKVEAQLACQLLNQARDANASKDAINRIVPSITNTICARMSSNLSVSAKANVVELAAQLLKNFDANSLDLQRLYACCVPTSIVTAAEVERISTFLSVLSQQITVSICNACGLKNKLRGTKDELWRAKRLLPLRPIPTSDSNESIRLHKVFEANDGSIAGVASAIDPSALGWYQESRSERLISKYAKAIVALISTLDEPLELHEGKMMASCLLARYTATLRYCDRVVLMALRAVDKASNGTAPLAEAAFLFGTNEEIINEVVGGTLQPRAAWKRSAFGHLFDSFKCALTVRMMRRTEDSREVEIRNYEATNLMNDTGQFEEIGIATDDQEFFATAAAYDPSFIVPVAAHCLREGILTAYDVTESGLLAVIINALASTDDIERAASHSALAMYQQMLQRDVRVQRKRQHEVLLEVCLCVLPSGKNSEAGESLGNDLNDDEHNDDEGRLYGNIPAACGSMQAQFLAEAALLLTAPDKDAYEPVEQTLVACRYKLKASAAMLLGVLKLVLEHSSSSVRELATGILNTAGAETESGRTILRKYHVPELLGGLHATSLCSSKTLWLIEQVLKQTAL